MLIVKERSARNNSVLSLKYFHSKNKALNISQGERDHSFFVIEKETYEVPLVSQELNVGELLLKMYL
jgi:hypothetical protein